MKHITTAESGPMRYFTFTDGGHTPTNKVPGTIQATGILEASFHQRAGWLSIHADEIVPHGKVQRTNRVWITMRETDATAFHGFLNARYGAGQLAALEAAERFIAGFEDDASQEGVAELLATIRAAKGG